MAQVRFKNSFYDPNNGRYSIEYHTYSENDFVESYYGYDIWRYSHSQWDIGKDGVIVGMRAGLNGARRKID